MPIYTGVELSKLLRDVCDGVEHRLWIASPYIGEWKSVRSILGKNWWYRSTVKMRLLTDENANPNGETLLRFIQRGPVYHLLGLHAKIYIIDDSVLLTSANLTGAAFSRRHEVGTMLTGSDAKSTIDLYESWLQDALARPFDYTKLRVLSKANRGEGGEDLSQPLPLLTQLPPDPGDFGGHKAVNLFLDYSRFLEDYIVLSEEYESIQRIWSVPLYFEVDGFLDFLFRHHENTPSKSFAKQARQKLTKEQRLETIRELAKKFKTWASKGGEDGMWRVERSNAIKEVLSRNQMSWLDKEAIAKVASQLNCMNDARQRNRFLKDSKNTVDTVRKAWTVLLHEDGQPLTERMSIWANSLFSFKRSSIQELLGFYDPIRYPFRNLTVNAGLRFLGFDVSAS